MKVVCLFVLLHLTISVIFGRHSRLDDIDRMGKHELIDITYDLESEQAMISFTAFGDDYKLFLDRNDDMNPSNIKHTHGVPSDSLGYYTSLTESCHYHVNKELTGVGFGGALSICDKRGLRGKVHGFNDTLTIGPAKYYLVDTTTLNENVYHDQSDEHLVFRASDYNTTGLKRPTSAGVPKKASRLASNANSHKIDDTSDELDSQMSNNKMDTSANLRNRNLLAINGGDQYTELLLLADPSYYTSYSSDYDELVAHLADDINRVSYDYENTDWGSDIGTIKVGFKELTIASSYSGNYAGLSPSYTSAGVVESGDYLEKFQAYIASYEDTGDFDHAMLFTDLDMDSGGIAWVSAVCKSGGSSTSVIGSGGGEAGTGSHELGHSFGCSHDQSTDNSCNDDSGIMGYGYNDWEFSSCSIEYVQTFFSDDSNYWQCTDDCSCLSDSIDYISGSDGNADDCDTSVKCVTISGLGSNTYDGTTYDFDGTWSYQGCWYNYPYYTQTIGGDTWYLYYSNYVNYPDDDAYVIFNELSYTNALARCTMSSGGSDPTDCSYWYQITWEYASWNYKSSVSETESSSCSYNTDSSTDDSSTDGGGDDDDDDEDETTTSNDDETTTSNDDETTTSNDDDSDDDDDDDNDSAVDLDCDAYNCVETFNFDSTYYDFNQEWTPTDCHNDEAYYTATISGVTWYLYYHGSNMWGMYYSLTDFYAYTYVTSCTDVAGCNGDWKSYGSSGYATDSDAYVSSTSCSSSSSRTSAKSSGTTTDDDDNDDTSVYFDEDLISTGSNCSNSYGSTVCMYNSGSLWDSGIATFEYIGCKYGRTPFWYYKYIEGNYTLTYYLHYIDDITDSGWYISEDSIETESGDAFCASSDLSQCEYNTWYVLNLYESDMLEYDIDVSMGYDSNCDSVSTSSDSDYCDSGDHACALWSFDLIIEDTSYTTLMCDSIYIGCVTEHLESQISDTSAFTLRCHGDYAVIASYNISFTSTTGYTIYSAFMDNYNELVNEYCDTDESIELTVGISNSNLHVCDSCQGFIQISNDDAQESSAPSARGVIGFVIIAMAFVAALY